MNLNSNKFKNDKRAKNYQQASDLEHARNQSAMYLGGKEPVEIESIYFENNNLLRHTLNYSLAATQCFREIITNASDQCMLLSNKNSNIYVDITDNLTFLNDNSFIWTSEKDGFNHIYHYDEDGNPLDDLNEDMVWYVLFTNYTHDRA